MLNHVQLFATPWTIEHQVSLSWTFPDKNIEVGFHFLTQGIFPIQDQTGVSCIGRQILYLWATHMQG